MAHASFLPFSFPSPGVRSSAFGSAVESRAKACSRLSGRNAIALPLKRSWNTFTASAGASCPLATRLSACHNPWRRSSSLIAGPFGRGARAATAFGAGSSAAVRDSAPAPAARITRQDATRAAPSFSFFRKSIFVTSRARAAAVGVAAAASGRVACGAWADPARASRAATATAANPLARSRFSSSRCAVARRLETVPSATPSRAAASFRRTPSSSHSTTAARYFSGNSASSASSAASNSASRGGGSTTRARASFVRRLAAMARAFSAVWKATPYSQSPTHRRSASASALRSSTRNVAWKASSASAAEPSTRRQVPNAMSAWRRTNSANAASSRRASRSPSASGSAAGPQASRGSIAAVIGGLTSCGTCPRRR